MLPSEHMVSLPPDGTFWCDPANQYSSACWHDSDEDQVISDNGPVLGERAASLLDDSSCRSYRAHFLQSEHFNFCGKDEQIGPLVLSLKYYSQTDNCNNHIRIILRLSSGTIHKLVDWNRDIKEHSPIKLARDLCPDLTLPFLQPVICPNTAEPLLNFDEHVLVNNFKFGVIYQNAGQASEEAIFGNRSHSLAMDKFLDMIGSRVELASHSGYRGGLDTQYGQTGQYSVYTEHMGKEVMYHVSTLLPFSESDPQQLERKRHIGNDIVSIVFQEESTPFSPDMVTSHFLHAYLVVQPDPGDPDKYRVSVTARSDVPYFGPSLPSPPVFRRGPDFREWILNKLMSAEISCYKADKFKLLKQRTQEALLGNLVEDLIKKTETFLDSTEIIKKPSKPDIPTSSTFFSAFRKVFTSHRKVSLPTQPDTCGQPGTDLGGEADSGCASVSSRSGEHDSHAGFETDSRDTVEEVLDNISNQSEEKSDTPSTYSQARGLLSSPNSHDGSKVMEEDPATSVLVSKLQQDVALLKLDKMELLRQNMAVEKEAQRLREQELKLQTHLITVRREINRLRADMTGHAEKISNYGGMVL